MIVIPLQYDGHRGPDAIGQHKLTFTMDESIATEFNPLTIKKGTQFLVMLVPAESSELSDFQSETPEETRIRFKKHFEALLSDIARIKETEHGEFRERFKADLIERGIIKDSTSELSIEQYAQLIVELRNLKYKLIEKI